MEKAQGNHKITSFNPDSDRNALVPIDLLSQSIMAAPYGYVVTDCGQKDNPCYLREPGFSQNNRIQGQRSPGKKLPLSTRGRHGTEFFAGDP